MSPRSKHLTPAFLLLLLGLLLAAPGPAFSGESGRNLFIRFYQEHISPVDGDRCPMTPSCSEYARQAVQKHGPVMGWIMACDRLMRCGRDEVRLSPARTVNGQRYTRDPVAANDFWWFTPPQEKQP